MTSRIPLQIVEGAGLDRANEPVSVGVPLPRGALFDPRSARLTDDSASLPMQLTPTALWPDGSFKWVVVDTLVTLPGSSSRRAWLQFDGASEAISHSNISIEEGSGILRAETGAGRVELRTQTADCLVIDGNPVTFKLSVRGVAHQAILQTLQVERTGPVKVAFSAHGSFPDFRGGPVLRLRVSAYSGSTRVVVQAILHNPNRALHKRGLWDLGDPGSCFFDDFSANLGVPSAAHGIEWYTNPDQCVQASEETWLIHQNSSGGERWDSPNHADHRGQLTVTHRGFRVTADRADVIADGGRAQPGCVLKGGNGSVGATVLGFWQNFPKSIRADGETLSLGVFPRKAGTEFELQGGEQKRHELIFDLSQNPIQGLRAAQQPLEIYVDPKAVANSRAIPYFTTRSQDPNADYLEYVDRIVDPRHGFAARRELIDEYGWRNFGDLYADHEAVNADGNEPFVSHYNNQYDFVRVAAIHYLRSADRRWLELLQDAVHHTIDIDIYHTQRDRAAYNGGMFWHTDHYVPAATSTHRTYSRANGKAGYGGGPSNEHNYTSGLVLYYLMTGDPEARAAVLELAEWVHAMDDGSRTLFALASRQNTGLASKTVQPDFHGPGRGAGNSIRACVNAFSLTRERRHLAKAESLIARCTHPEDDPQALSLSEPEYRWSYLVYLEALNEYLLLKEEWGELDYHYHYGAAVLRRYAAWMADHEVPYREILDRVDIPSETWPAQDMRKSYVLNAASRFEDSDTAMRYRERAREFFRRSLLDTNSFPTASLTRPLVIIAGSGCSQAYFDLHAAVERSCQSKAYAFGTPSRFVPQGQSWPANFREALSAGASEMKRIVREQLPGGRR